MDVHAATVDDVLRSTSTTASSGLSTAEARVRLAKYGPNKLKEIKKTSPLTLFVRQFKDVVVYILLVALILSLAVGERLDAYIILAIMFFNALLGFFQEYKAEKAIELLKKLTTLKAKVIRNGKLVCIQSHELVPGDIVVVEQGDKIGADMRVIEASSLQTDEASLTGESMPCNKQIQPLSKTTDLAERSNMLYSGTTVVRGTGRAVVISTGMRTEIGKIATLVQEEDHTQTPLQARLKELGIFLGYLTGAIALLVFLVGIMRNIHFLESFLTAIALAVAVIPEGLPAIVTVCLALSVQHMVKKNALIRRLKSIETLGSITVICSDKTGTLTKNEMTVKRIYTNNKEIFVSGDGYDVNGHFFFNEKPINPEGINRILDIAMSCNNSSDEVGDPTERALYFAAAKGGVTRRERLNEIPFDADKKYMATTHKIERQEVIYYKGAPEVLIATCKYIDVDNRQGILTREDVARILQKNQDMADAALRVLAMAYEVRGKRYFVGLMGMIDPPKEGVKEALAICWRAGIRSVIITGDHPRTAVAIAKKIGMNGAAITGAELNAMTEQQLSEIVETHNIFARTTSRHKVMILEALQKRGHIVAMTGDGINDAPALKRANIGIAMSIKGTDVSRETADMVLADDNFATIVKAIEEGRVVYDNIKKFINYLLSANTAEVGVILLGLLLGLPLPLLPIHILWVNLMTDSWPALALSVDTPGQDIMQRKPRHPKESLFKNMKGQIIVTGVVGTVIILGIFWYALQHWTEMEARTMALTTMILFEVLRSFSCKSYRPLHKMFSNNWLNLAVLVSVALHLIILYSPLNAAFKVSPLQISEWLYVLGTAVTGFMLIEMYKAVQYARSNHQTDLTVSHPFI